MKKITIILGMALFALFLAGCSSITGGAVANEGDVVSIPLSDISEKVSFYTYNDLGIEISYFVVLGSDGEPRTAFDACDVCGGYNGYRQVGTDIQCRKCERVFSIDGLGTQNKGYGCWPSYLPHTIENGNVIIKVSDIKSGRKKFA